MPNFKPPERTAPAPDFQMTEQKERLWDYDNPLQRCAALRESAVANQALRDYAMMGARRSLRSLLEEYRRLNNEDSTKKPPTLSWNTLSHWSLVKDWVKRVTRHDEIEQERAQREWRDRRGQLREQEWAKAQELLDRAAAMLKFPLSVSKTTHEEVLEDGRIIVQNITVKPVRWTSATIAQFLKTASELARLSAEMETERVKVDSGPVITIAADDMAEAARMAAEWEQKQYGGEDGEV